MYFLFLNFPSQQNQNNYSKIPTLTQLRDKEVKGERERARTESIGGSGFPWRIQK